MDGARLKVEGLVKRFGPVSALNGFTLSAAAGEIVGLVGANGSGKTTFVDVVIGLTRPDQGSVYVCGVDALRSPRAAHRRMASTPQEIALYLPVTTLENLQVFGGLAGLRGTALRRSITDVVDQMHLADVLDRPVGQLSGGQQRRVQVATALLGSPDVLLLDEPTVGADPPTRQALLSAVRQRAAGGTIRDNIGYGRPGAGDEEIVAAARTAYVDEFVRVLPAGYDTVVDTDSSGLSAGQKQLLTIARAFLADPGILILDEATSNVDTRTEAMIQDAMTRLRAGRTSFVIAHRLSTIRAADTIVVMDEGRIVEQGGHDELLDHRGLYHEMYHSQFTQPLTS